MTRLRGSTTSPPNAFKAMDEANLRHHFNFIVEFWEDRLDFEEWHEGQVVPVPKSGGPLRSKQMERGKPDGYRGEGV